MSETEISCENIGQILAENNQIISIIMKCQSEGRMMDSLLYQTRLHLNLVQLAAVADNNIHPSLGNRSGNTVNTGKTEMEKQMKSFIRVVKANGMKNLNLISELTSIPISDVEDMCQSFLDYLKNRNRHGEYKKYQQELAEHYSSNDSSV